MSILDDKPLRPDDYSQPIMLALTTVLTIVTILILVNLMTGPGPWVPLAVVCALVALGWSTYLRLQRRLRADKKALVLIHGLVVSWLATLLFVISALRG